MTDKTVKQPRFWLKEQVLICTARCSVNSRSMSSVIVPTKIVNQISCGDFYSSLAVFWHLQNTLHFTIAVRQGQVTRAHLPHWHTTLQRGSGPKISMMSKEEDFHSLVENHSLVDLDLLFRRWAVCQEHAWLYMHYRMRGRCEVPDGGRFWWEADFEKWNWCALSWRKLLDLFPASMTCTKYCSACWIKEGTNGAVAPNSCKFAKGSAWRAAFFVPILMVISHPVRLCSAGSTVHIRVPSLSCKIWSGTNRVVLLLPAFTHSSWRPSWRKVGT